MEQEKVNYDVLRHQLKLLSKEFRACEDFLSDIDNINCKVSFKRFLNSNMENICNKLDIDIFNDEDEIEDLQDQLDDANRDVERLEEELDDLKYKYGINENSTLEEEYRCEYFFKYKNNYTAWELEELLKGGRIFLTDRQFIQKQLN